MSDRPDRQLGRAMALGLALFCAGATAAPLGYGDPTEPTSAAGVGPADAIADAPVAPPEQTFDLSSTLVAARRRVAIINGRSVAVGSIIDGARLAEIDSRGVLLEYQGRRIRLDLPSGDGNAVVAKTPRGK